MSNRIKIILIAVLLIGIVFGADRILKMQGENYINNNLENSDEGEKFSKILEITSESFSGEVLESEEVVLIDFYATWCNYCKVLAPVVEEIARERDDIKVVRIDVDKCSDVANEYRIYSLPTLLVIENGVEKNRVTGVVSKEEIENML